MIELAEVLAESALSPSLHNANWLAHFNNSHSLGHHRTLWFLHKQYPRQLYSRIGTLHTHAFLLWRISVEDTQQLLFSYLAS